MGWPEECDKQVKGFGGRHCVDVYHCQNFNRFYGGEDYCIKWNLGHAISTCECYNNVLSQYLKFDDLSEDERKAVLNNPITYLDTMSDKCYDLKMNSPKGTWKITSCYCCCACFAYDTPIAIPGGFKAIQDLRTEDQVLVANPQVREGKVQLSWYPKDVSFSSGTGPDGHEPVMIYIHYADELELICNVDQIFLMPDGKLKRADKLMLGEELMMADGGTARIHDIKPGGYDGGVHHIATDLEFKGSMEGHLLNTNGIVTGDYLLQIHQKELGELGLFAENHQDLPVIGTPEYESRNASLKAQLSSTDMPEVPEKKPPAVFKAFAYKDDDMPYDAQSFFSYDEELALDGSPKRNITEKDGIEPFEYYSKIIRAFYPDIIFYLDWKNSHINAYSFTRYGQKVVLIPGGLLRLKDLGMEGLVIILASQVSRFYGGEPLNEKGYTCTGAADFYGIGVVLRDALFKNWIDIISAGTDQLIEIFKTIKTVLGDSSEEDIDRPSPDCRMRTMFAAAYGAHLPECAGGASKYGLILEDAKAVRLGASVILDATFNRNLSSLAEKKENYRLEPAAEVYEARIDPQHRRTVKLNVGCQPETDYTLTVMNVTAADGSTLDPTANSYLFKSPANPSA
jgi:hypothetical protein